jgi:hypothetical protein
MRHQPDGSVAVVNDPLGEPLIGDLVDIALRCPQDSDPLRDQGFGGKRRVPGALQADELGNILEALTENVLLAFRQHRYRACAEPEQLLFSSRIVQHVQDDEAEAFLRKKLFRSQATASTRLGEKDEFVPGGFHFDLRNEPLN